MIGIVTFHFAYNYGAALQAYALNRYINEHIGSCKIINYRPLEIESNYHITLRSVLSNPKRFFVKLRRQKQDALFNNFVYKVLKCEKKSSVLSDEVNQYDSFITGSDQVWNTELTHNDLNYFLAFSKEGQKRIAYGASIGNSSIVQNYTDEVIAEIEKFEYLSCREISAIHALESKIGRQMAIESVVDPTLLLSKEAWISLSKKPEGKIPEKYIVYYALTESKELTENAEMISKEYSLPILSIHPMAKKWKMNGKNMNNVGPLEFLWLIYNAEFICTNSFHGSVFSAVFEKKCVLAAHQTLGERNKQLLEWMNLTQKSFGQVIDFSVCDYERLNVQIENSKEYLNKALG